MKTPRHRALRLAGVVCLVGLVLQPVSPAGAADPSERLEAVNRQLGAAEEGLADVAGRRRVTLDDLQGIDERREQIAARLQTLRSEQAQAQASLTAAQQRLQATTAQLVATGVALERTRADLQRLRDQFAGRARVSFMYGGTDAVGVVLDVRDVGELTRGITYLSNVLAEDDRQVGAMAALEQRVLDQATQLAGLRALQAQERATAEAERLRIDGLFSEAAGLKREADTQARQREAVLAQLEADRREYSAVVDRLEAESAQLAEQLRAQAAAEAARERQQAAAEQAQQPVAAVPRASAAPGGFQLPVSGSITSGFGNRLHPIYGYERMHTGLDFGAGSGTPIYAAAGGTVSIAGSYSGYGNTVAISHGGGVSTLYAHQSRLAVSSGQQVSQGELIGYVGSTGASTGPHLHFEVRENGSPVDPSGYL